MQASVASLIMRKCSCTDLTKQTREVREGATLSLVILTGAAVRRLPDSWDVHQHAFTTFQGNSAFLSWTETWQCPTELEIKEKEAETVQIKLFLNPWGRPTPQVDSIKS